MRVNRYLITLILVIALQSGYSKSIDNWFEFQPKYPNKLSVIHMNDWIEAPAGQHGFLQIQDEKLVFEDGRPIKLWGTNICSGRPYVDKAVADSFVQILSRYGMNSIRFHKFSWHGYAKDQSTKLAEDKWERLDYFQAKMREHGLYYGWSHIYGHRAQEGDRDALIAYDEIKNLKYPWSHLNGSTSCLVNFASDLQDLSIGLTVHMLNHINPHTGLRYADDPALAFIEFQNENNIFWASHERALEQAPTYKAMFCKLFSEWLLKKYKTQSAFEKAWGEENIPEGQSLEAMNLYPQPNHGLFDWEYKMSIKEGSVIPQHIHDKMRFLYETQLAYYKKFAKAIRDTGYKGVLVSTCWQAGSGFSHFYNLHTDYEIGMIDRHNYFGGGAGGHQLAVGPVENTPLLDRPGSGLLSIGMQQVIDRPFSFSEWMSLVPNEWTAEAAPIIAAYGMGLQGWDASYSFATDVPRFSRLLESEWHGLYNATSPLHMGLYPTLARMVYRDDVKESPILTTRNVHIPSLIKGKLGFEEVVEMVRDVKTLTGSIPSDILAIGKFPVKFTDVYEETVIPDFSKYHDKKNKVMTSVTGELVWHYGENKYITINTKNTKGVVGFVPNQEIKLDDWTISIENPFAVVLITSLSKDENLKGSPKILITTIARGRNTGMTYTANGDTLLTKGGRPLLLEPVNVEIQSAKLKKSKVIVLDHDGVVTKQSVPIKKTKAVLNGEKYQTMYYLVKSR